jgi:hypothetical protein
MPILSLGSLDTLDALCGDGVVLQVVVVTGTSNEDGSWS